MLNEQTVMILGFLFLYFYLFPMLYIIGKIKIYDVDNKLDNKLLYHILAFIPIVNIGIFIYLKIAYKNLYMMRNGSKLTELYNEFKR